MSGEPGRLVEWHPIDALVAAVAQIKERYPNAEVARAPVTGGLLIASGPNDDDPQVGDLDLLFMEVDWYEKTDDEVPS